MRTNIDIDDALMDQTLKASPFKTRKDAVESGLRLIAAFCIESEYALLHRDRDFHAFEQVRGQRVGRH
jgi:Arc/MetJ family transcription regulator